MVLQAEDVALINLPWHGWKDRFHHSELIAPILVASRKSHVSVAQHRQSVSVLQGASKTRGKGWTSVRVARHRSCLRWCPKTTVLAGLPTNEKHHDSTKVVNIQQRRYELLILPTCFTHSRQAVAETCSSFKMRSQLLRAAARSRPTTNAIRSRTFSSSARRPAEVELTIDGKKVSIEAGSALIQACEKAGVTIPRYCYHEYVPI